MKLIIVAHLPYYRNEAHYEFMIRLRNLLLKYPDLVAKLDISYEAFTALLDLEARLVDPLRKSDLTKPVREADRRVDRCITGIHNVVNAGLRHYQPETVAAAQSLHNRLQAFGPISKKSYEEETAAVNLLIAELSGEYAGKVEILQLGGWVEELAQAELTFETLLNRRSSERAQKPQEHLRDVRHDMDIACHRIIDFVNASATVDTEGLYTELIALLNVEILYFNEHAHRHARKEIAHVTVADIPTQPYTGKPVIVIPTVFFTEAGKPDVELVFAKDFTVTYKDNGKVGTATLVIHGKGAYTGTKAITFNIAAQMENSSEL
jgi:hypothetical protein